MSEPLSPEAERRITIALAIALIALLPSLVLGALLWREVDTRTNANQQLLESHAKVLKQQEVIRREARRVFRRAVIDNCKENELVKGRLREIVRFKPEQVALTLTQLGIDPASERGQQLTERAKQSSDNAVRALRKRTCALPIDPAG